MNEDLQDTIAPEAAPPGVGEILKAAREAKGWSTQEVGARLRLMARQIEAMEAEDFASLGQPVFARGFVRNYARLFELDAEALLAQMSPASVPHVPQAESLPFAPKPGFWTSPWVMSSIGAIILVLAVPTVLYLWLNSGEKEKPVTQKVEQPALPPSPPPAPMTETSPDMQPETQPGMPPAVAPQPGFPAGQMPAPTTVPGATPAAAMPGQPVTLPATQVKPPAPANTVAPAISATPATATPAAANAAAQSIQFRFMQPAWLQVRDSTGKLVHSALNPAGSAIEVSGSPPFSLVIGNAANVQVAYKNKPVDIKPYIDVTVARFTLN